MTEDDTFNTLRRLPAKEVLRLWHISSCSGVFEFYIHVTEHHWTLEEFLTTYAGFTDLPDDWIEDVMGRYRDELKDYNIEV